MAQLIKLEDYVSRYETDMLKYPGQFIRLKKQRWDRMKELWDVGMSPNVQGGAAIESTDESKPLLQSMRQWFSRGEETEVLSADIDDDMATHPMTLEELKQTFREEMLRFRFKWATSSISEKSFVDKTWYQDEQLVHFLQAYPDNHLLMHRPVFKIKQAPIELDTILITPLAVWIFVLVNGKGGSVFQADKGRFWFQLDDGDTKKVLNPMISLKRTESIITDILRREGVEIPIKRALISRHDYLDFPHSPAELFVIDRRNYPQFHKKTAYASTPLKHMQIKAAKVLLNACQTTSYRRAEWDYDSGE